MHTYSVFELWQVLSGLALTFAKKRLMILICVRTSGGVMCILVAPSRRSASSLSEPPEGEMEADELAPHEVDLLEAPFAAAPDDLRAALESTVTL